MLTYKITLETEGGEKTEEVMKAVDDVDLIKKMMEPTSPFFPPGIKEIECTSEGRKVLPGSISWIEKMINWAFFNPQYEELVSDRPRKRS